MFMKGDREKVQAMKQCHEYHGFEIKVRSQ
uniref:Uncharacterized protein n=1 Tax=Arundo donax TaxID=35708 RepID=A0A0A9BJM2_ARUDO